MDTKSLQLINYGLYIICSKRGDKINGQVADTVTQVCSQPPTITVGINKGNLTHEFIHDSKVFTVSILSEDTPLSFIGNFGFKSGRDIDKFEGVDYKLGKTKAPIVLSHALAYIEAEVVNEIDVGTHTIFVGEIVDAEVIKDDKPMTYAYYHQVKRGVTPKAAPSYIEKNRIIHQNKKRENKKERGKS